MGRLFAWLKRALASPRAPLACVAFAVALALPTLAHGITADDYWHKLAFTGVAPEWAPMKNGWWDLFLFFDGGARNAWLREVGMVPWWADPDVRIMFFRPLASATHALDYALWPTKPWVMHLHSVAWFAALTLAASWAYGRLFARVAPESRWVVGLASLFYALDYTHGLPVAWLANRNAVIAGVFALAALAAHDAATKASSTGARARWSVLSGALLALGLAAGESALAVCGYLAAHAVWLDDRPLGARLRSFLPHVGAVVAWWIAYRTGGFGATGSAMYIEPLREPWLFAGSALQSLPLLAAAELGAPPPDLYVFLPLGVRAILLGFALVFVAWASLSLVRACRESPLARALLGGGLLSLLPACATFPSARLLVIPSFGLVGIVAIAFAGLVDGARWIPERGPQRVLVRSYLVWTGLGHLFLCPLAFEGTAQQMPLMGAIVRNLAEDLPTDPAPERVVVVNAPDALFIAFVLAERRLNDLPTPARMFVLAAGQRDLRISRESDDTIIAEQDDGFYRVGTEVILRKSTAPLPVGAVVRAGEVEVEVLDTTSDGVARRVRVRLGATPSDPRKLAFRRWQGGHLVPFPLPPIGQTTTVPGQLLQLTPPTPSPSPGR
ncbi:MAG: hypothetical protein JST00_18770 [Deltaproteobacteria bacterium]|nr:hypothetical protein [Deltaproteobacteria bacterium]